MQEQKTRLRRPRYMEKTEEVVHGLGGYFLRRLGRVQKRKTELYELMDQKQRVRDSLPKNWLARRIASIRYGDWLTDYETEAIEHATRAEVRLTEVMTEVIHDGRVDRAEAELLLTIDGCFKYLKSLFRTTDSVGRRLASQSIEYANEAISALAVVNPKRAEELKTELSKIVEREIWWGPEIE